MINCHVTDCEYLTNGHYCRFDTFGMVRIIQEPDGTPVCANYEPFVENEQFGDADIPSENDGPYDNFGQPVEGPKPSSNQENNVKEVKKRVCSYCGMDDEENGRQPFYHLATKGAKGVYLCFACYDNGYEPQLYKHRNGTITAKPPRASSSTSNDAKTKSVKGDR